MNKSIMSKGYTVFLVIIAISLLVMQFDVFGNDKIIATENNIATENLDSNQYNQNNNQINNQNNQNSLENFVANNTNSISSGEVTATIEDGVQVFKFDLQPNSYPTLNVKTGMPVKLIINADEYSLNSCNYSLVSYDLNVFKDLDYGENIIEFTPAVEGQYAYTCWMGMIGAYINVSDAQEAPEAFYGENVSAGGCCSR